MKVKTILSRIYYIIVAVCVFLHVVILSLSFFDNKHQEKYCRSIIPDREYQTDEDNRRFVFSAQKIKDGGDCLRFYTAHMEVSVYADDTLIYHVGQQQAMPKVSPGVMWNYVGIPWRTVNISLSPAAPLTVSWTRLTTTLPSRKFRKCCWNAVSLARPTTI